MIKNIEPIILNNVKDVKFRIESEDYIFDKKGFELFMTDFNLPESNVTAHKGYLVRIKKFSDKEWIEYFHRWLMHKRSKSLLEKHFQVHHKNRNIRDNRLRNLKIIDSEEHAKIHRKKKARETYIEKFMDDHPDSSYATANHYWLEFWEKIKDDYE